MTYSKGGVWDTTIWFLGGMTLAETTKPKYYKK